MRTQKIAITVALLAGLGTACGGGASGKLSRHVSDGHLAPVSPEERMGESEARREFFLAEWQAAYTESQIRAAKLDIDLAKNDLASAKLAVKNAALELRAAEDGNDQNAIAKMQQAEKVAHLNVEVEKLKIARAKQSKHYLEKRLAHEKRALLSSEASLELARAKSLTSAGIQPPNFDAKKYKAQHTSRAASAKETKAAVDGEKTKLSELEKQLLAAQNKALAADGKPVLAPTPEESSPMEPLETEGASGEPEAPAENSPEEPASVEQGDAPEEGTPSEGEAKPGDAATPETGATEPASEEAPANAEEGEASATEAPSKEEAQP